MLPILWHSEIWVGRGFTGSPLGLYSGTSQLHFRSSIKKIYYISVFMSLGIAKVPSQLFLLSCVKNPQVSSRLKLHLEVSSRFSSMLGERRSSSEMSMCNVTFLFVASLCTYNAKFINSNILHGFSESSPIEIQLNSVSSCVSWPRGFNSPKC